MALFFEDEGFSRTAGRLFGCLLLSPAPRSLDQLARALQASKASVSTESRLLERRGIVERVRRPADRRIYYQVPADLPARTMELRLDRMRRFSGLIRAVPARPRRASTVVDARFRDIDAAYTLMIAALAGALAEWRRRPVRRRIARRASPS
ncbi:MAG TPA: MarR family transcriptional regulator [Gemmatimonadales bacterium]|nr:MarR family transcriptional regulator [Gemmatimonadales bacterium]